MFTFEYHEAPSKRAVVGLGHAIKSKAQKQLGQFGLTWPGGLDGPVKFRPESY